MKKLIKLNLEHWIFAGILLFVFLLRIPSLFEPYWYGDEGIFAAVAKNLNMGGVLYQTAWDNKPPLIYLTYSTIFRFFGVSMFNIHLAATIAVMTTATFIYLIVRKSFNSRRALAATAIFGFLSTLRLIEGNLALTEIFMIVLISLAFLMAIYRKFDRTSLIISGILFGVASLYKQVGAFEAAALGIYLFFISKNFKQFFVKGLFLTTGFVLPIFVTFAYFLRLNLHNDFIFASYTYYRIYLNESPQYAALINLLKYSPIFLAIAYGFYKKRKKQLGISNLFILWLSFSFLGSFFSGRAYGHYMVQALPAFAIVLATISYKLKFDRVSALFGLSIFVILVILTRLLFSNAFSLPIDQIKYYKNYFEFLNGKQVDEYNDFFDKNVNSIMASNDFLERRKARGKSVYIWGDYSWLYAISGVWNPSRYVTSFHVFGVPNGMEEVITSLNQNPPVYILKPPSSIGYFLELEKLISRDYTFVSRVSDVDIYERKKDAGETSTKKE